MIMKQIIPKRNSSCCLDQQKFVGGIKIYSILCTKKEEWQRIDYCEHCWTNNKAQLLQQAVVFWESLYPLKEKKKEHPDNNALDLFKELAFFEDQETLYKRFMLALYLERKNQIVLRYKNLKMNIFSYEIYESGEIYDVKAVFSVENSMKIHAELMQYLSNF